MDRHTAHGDRVILLFVACRESNGQSPGRHNGVVLEKLVKVAHAKEQQGITSLRLQLLILLHHRRDARSSRERRGSVERSVCGFEPHNSVSHLPRCGIMPPEGVPALAVQEPPYGGAALLSARD